MLLAALLVVSAALLLFDDWKNALLHPPFHQSGAGRFAYTTAWN